MKDQCYEAVLRLRVEKTPAGFIVTPHFAGSLCIGYQPNPDLRAAVIDALKQAAQGIETETPEGDWLRRDDSDHWLPDEHLVRAFAPVDGLASGTFEALNWLRGHD